MDPGLLSENLDDIQSDQDWDDYLTAKYGKRRAHSYTVDGLADPF